MVICKSFPFHLKKTCRQAHHGNVQYIGIKINANLRYSEKCGIADVVYAPIILHVDCAECRVVNLQIQTKQITTKFLYNIK